MLEKQKSKSKITKESLKNAINLYKYITPYKWHFIVGLILLAVSSLLFMIFPGIAGEMANTANGTPRIEDISVRDYGLIFLLILVVQALVSYFRSLLFAEVSERGMADIRKDVYNKILGQSVPFFEERRVGEMTSRITSDVEKIQSAFSTTLAEFIRQIVTLIVGIAILGWLAPRLSLVMLLTIPVIVLLAMVFGRYILKMSRKRQDTLAVTNTIAEETLQNFVVVKSFANEWFEKVRYGKSIQDVVDISIKFAKVRGLFIVFLITILFGGIFFILWQGALFVEQGVMELGDLFSFIIYTSIIGAAIASLGSLYTELASALGAMGRVLEILNSDPEIDVNEQRIGKTNLRLEGDIELDSVVFAYPSRPELNVLQDTSIKIKEGSKIALVGTSGAGKSTIIQLLMRFYSPQSGTIKINNNFVETYDLSDYRDNFAVVPQDVTLFGGTIRENIIYGRPNATENEIIEAAKQANAYDFIVGFTEGFDTVVGERGIKLSGGQRQRIAIARALLKNPAILILDEATSSLDAESEKSVQEALDVLMEGRTSIIIAHRLATIKEVDCIFVLDKGKIIESGKHEELLDQNGLYASLARLQFHTSPLSVNENEAS